ncbi:MAG: UDP-N-acetylmuramoylalanyl-D-glutamate--2,6-diaminopimelate ligase [Desulfovibrio sp.]|nr:UDP-N-acetylmuramoylalanyl-D-glutamate--2,6-diaminopimelate ligase [Desulfovibrio sp.]
MNLTLADVERCLSGMSEEGHEKVTINSVQTDSRTVYEGDLFFCIDGANFDGHEFAHQAERQGAAAVVASRVVDVDVPVIMVRDTTEALGRIAACWRDMCGARLVAVTGTAGKTTVKEMLFAVVSQKHTAAKNYRNFNNQIGLPMSMLKGTCNQDWWIMELGISVRGDMEELAPIASPDVAVITNIGHGHLEGLGDMAGVAQAKTALLRYVRQAGSAVVSMDYPMLWDAAREINNAPVGFSTQNFEDADFAASYLGAESEGWGRFRLKTPEGDSEMAAPFCGEHYAENLACVAATAHQLGLSRDDVINGVQAIEPDSQRFCCKSGGNFMVIDDTYNANPLSMERSIKAAANMAGERPLVLVLGDMRELGEEAVEQHVKLGKLAAEIAPKALFYKGDHLDDVAAGYGGVITELKDTETFIKKWQALGLTGAVALVKGSRSLSMETYANLLSRELGCKAGTEEKK